MARRSYKRRKSNKDLSGFILLFILVLSSQLGIENVIKYIVIIAVAVVSAVILYKLYKRNVMLSSGIDIVDKMSGIKFEEFLKVHFKQQGYKVQLTPASNDYGADIIIQSKGIRTVVQAKRWSHNVGIEAVQQVVGAINYYEADNGMVITNSYFTQQAINLAHSNNIELWDRKKLIQFFSKNNGRIIAEESINNTALDEATYEEEDNNTCPKCGNKLIVRNGKRGKFWGCSGYPACRFTRDFVE